MSNRRQSVASQLQSERDCRRWAGWMNGRLEGAIAAAELAAIGAEEFAARLRSGVVLWMLLETFADPKELLPAGRQAPRGLREGAATLHLKPGPGRPRISECLRCEHMNQCFQLVDKNMFSWKNGQSTDCKFC